MARKFEKVSDWLTEDQMFVLHTMVKPGAEQGLVSLTIEALREYHFHAQALSDKLEVLSRDLLKVKNNMLENGWMPNSMGEVQGQGGAIDRLCALTSEDFKRVCGLHQMLFELFDSTLYTITA